MGLNFKFSFIFLIICFSSGSFAGRPVFQNLTISDITAQAEWVIVVNKLKIKNVKLDCGWESQIYEVQPIEILQSKKSSKNLTLTQRLSFDPFPNLTRDCQLRKKNLGGASFSASKYSSTLDMSKIEKTPQFVIFLSLDKKSDFQLVADHALEDVDVVRNFLKESAKEK